MYIDIEPGYSALGCKQKPDISTLHFNIDEFKEQNVQLENSA